MKLRVVATIAGLAVACVAMTGCLGTGSEPTPTRTAVFSSEAEAFAAAEETYRAYIDAVNARRADPLSEPDPQSFLVGEALEADLESLRESERIGIRVVGNSTVAFVTPASANLQAGEVVVHACYDSTDARVLNDANEEVTVEGRDATVLAEVHVVSLDGQLLIDDLLGIVSEEC